MSTMTMLAVNDVEKSSQWLQRVFGWKSNHGGPHFEELVNSDKSPLLMLHHLDADEHPQLKNLDEGNLGIGVTVYVNVPNLNETFEKAKGAEAKILDEPHFNELAHQHEFSFKDINGYTFTAFTK